MLRSSQNAFDTKASTNGKEFTGATRIQKLDSSVRKPKGSGIDQSKPCGDQAPHFVYFTKSPNALNSFCNCKKPSNSSKARPTMCVSFANEGKTKVGWVVAIGQRMQR